MYCIICGKNIDNSGTTDCSCRCSACLWKPLSVDFGSPYYQPTEIIPQKDKEEFYKKTLSTKLL
jgi:hypothetical protein